MAVNSFITLAPSFIGGFAEQNLMLSSSFTRDLILKNHCLTMSKKLFCSSPTIQTNKLECLSVENSYHPNPIFMSKARGGVNLIKLFWCKFTYTFFVS